MTSRVREETDVWRILLFGENGTELLVLRSLSGFRLPELRIPRFERVAPHLNAEAQGLWNLDTVCLDVNAPAWHEGYHRRWSRGGAEGDALTVWRVELPLFGNGQILGRLSVSGSHDRECIAEKLEALSRLVEQAEALASAISLPAALASQGSGFVAELARVPRAQEVPS